MAPAVDLDLSRTVPLVAPLLFFAEALLFFEDAGLLGGLLLGDRRVLDPEHPEVVHEVGAHLFDGNATNPSPTSFTTYAGKNSVSTTFRAACSCSRANDEETAIAVAIAERIAPLIAATFAAHVVRPVPADARTWVLGDRRVAQAPNGLWLVTNGAGTVLASTDTYDEARRALEAPAAQDGALIASSSRDLPIEMERDHAARWVQKQLREHGYETHVEGSTITLVLPGRSPILRVSPAGLLVDPNVPSLARLVAEAALRNVGVVERLE